MARASKLGVFPAASLSLFSLPSWRREVKGHTSVARYSHSGEGNVWWGTLEIGRRETIPFGGRLLPGNIG